MIRVTGDRVLVALPPKEHVQEAVTGYTYQEGSTRASGIVLAKPADVYNVDLATRGIVVALGEKKRTMDEDALLEYVNEFVFEAIVKGGYDRDSETPRLICDAAEMRANIPLRTAPEPFDVQPGDCVLFSPSAGDQINYDGRDFVILHESEIIGVVDPATTDSADAQ
jgi:co-chaperonin GroES (HSP10)